MRATFQKFLSASLLNTFLKTILHKVTVVIFKTRVISTQMLLLPNYFPIFLLWSWGYFLPIVLLQWQYYRTMYYRTPLSVFNDVTSVAWNPANGGNVYTIEINELMDQSVVFDFLESWLLNWFFPIQTTSSIKLCTFKKKKEL